MPPLAKHLAEVQAKVDDCLDIIDTLPYGQQSLGYVIRALSPMSAVEFHALASSDRTRLLAYSAFNRLGTHALIPYTYSMARVSSSFFNGEGELEEITIPLWAETCSPERDIMGPHLPYAMYLKYLQSALWMVNRGWLDTVEYSNGVYLFATTQLPNLRAELYHPENLKQSTNLNGN